MSNKVKRNYKGADAEMLTAIATITEAAIDNQTELAAKRASWADPFFPNLRREIDTTVQTYLGADSVKDLRVSTKAVGSIQAGAINDLLEVKVQVQRDFRQDPLLRDEILHQLGYKEFFRSAYLKDQGALVQLLFRFKQALTPGIQDQLTAKGIAPATLANITGYADTLNDANISQESFKGLSKVSTQAAVSALNGIYNKVMDVAIIAAKIFKADKAKQERFSYTKILKAQQGNPKSTEEIPERPALTIA